MPARQLLTPLAVVVLGMLSEEPLHPYGMRRRIEERAYDRMPGVKVTSLYDVVRRLTAADLIHAEESDRAGNRPERTRYAITPAGAQELTAWVTHTLTDHTDADSFPTGLSFMFPLGHDLVAALLETRKERLVAAINADENELSLAQTPGTNPIFLSEHHYQLARHRAEADWLTGFLTALNNGTLTWPE
jgi:DNA-binding PadR family transcriptional regulator